MYAIKPSHSSMEVNKTEYSQTTGQESGHASFFPWEWLSANMQQKPSPVKYYYIIFKFKDMYVQY